MLHLVPGLIVKIATSSARRFGLMPQSTYVHEITRAIKDDDLDRAINLYWLSVKRWRPSEKTEVARELILQAIDIRVSALQRRIDEIEGLLAARRGFCVWIRQVWHRVASVFRRQRGTTGRTSSAGVDGQSARAQSEEDLRAEMVEHRAMIQQLLSMRGRLDRQIGDQ